MTASKQRKQRLADLIRPVRLEGDAEARKTILEELLDPPRPFAPGSQRYTKTYTVLLPQALLLERFPVRP